MQLLILLTVCFSFAIANQNNHLHINIVEMIHVVKYRNIQRTANSVQTLPSLLILSSVCGHVVFVDAMWTPIVCFWTFSVLSAYFSLHIPQRDLRG